MNSNIVFFDGVAVPSGWRVGSKHEIMAKETSCQKDLTAINVGALDNTAFTLDRTYACVFLRRAGTYER